MLERMKSLSMHGSNMESENDGVLMPHYSPGKIVECIAELGFCGLSLWGASLIHKFTDTAPYSMKVGARPEPFTSKCRILIRLQLLTSNDPIHMLQ